MLNVKVNVIAVYIAMFRAQYISISAIYYTSMDK